MKGILHIVELIKAAPTAEYGGVVCADFRTRALPLRAEEAAVVAGVSLVYTDARGRVQVFIVTPEKST